MGHSREDKARTHQRIVDIAARRFREVGFDGISIAELMQEAGLTHGGFYKHFGSREELVTEALAVALKSGASYTVPGHEAREHYSTLRGVFDVYLHPHHRDDVGGGCAVGALCNDVGRASEEAKRLYTAQVERNIAGISRLMAQAEGEDTRPQAILAFTVMVGALALSRGVASESLSAEFIDTARSWLVAEFAENSAETA